MPGQEETSENSVPVEPVKVVESKQEGGISPKFIVIVIGLFIFLGIVALGLAVLLINNSRTGEESSGSSTTTASTTSSRSTSTISSVSSSVSSSSSSTVASGNVYLDLYFSKDPESSDDYDYFASVDRVTTRLDVATFLTEEYLEGPTDAEVAAGFYVGSVEGPAPTFTDTSNCSGKDFGINIIDRVATLRFCRTLVARGGAYDARFLEGLKYNIDQFDTVDKTIVLDKTGHCLFDLSGSDECLE